MRRKTRKNVGVIGLGIIGSRAAAGLRAAGFHCFVWNRTARPVPNFLGSPAEVAASCEIIQLFVADAAATMEVLQALAPKLTPAHIVISSATIGPEATREAAKFVESHGARFLDAPFTGSKVAAENRQLVYYVGGDDAVFLPAKPMLEATSKAIVRTGKVGDAALIKIVTNQIAAVSIQVLAEALALVRKAGVPQEVFAAALEHNAARSGTMDLKLPKMMAGDYDPHFSLKHMFKDVQIAIHMANAMNLDTPAAAVTAGVLYGAIKRGWGDQDFSALYRLYSEEMGDSPGAAQLANAPAPQGLADAPATEGGENSQRASPGEGTPGSPTPVTPPSIWVGGKPSEPAKLGGPDDEPLEVAKGSGAPVAPPAIFSYKPAEATATGDSPQGESAATSAPPLWP